MDQNEEEETVLVLIMEVTSKAPKSPPTKHDQFKVPIIDWKQAGLDKFSYGKVNKTAILNRDALSQKNYIGRLSNNDLERLKHFLLLYYNTLKENIIF